jgi:hypothetical protein
LPFGKLRQRQKRVGLPLAKLSRPRLRRKTACELLRQIPAGKSGERRRHAACYWIGQARTLANVEQGDPVPEFFITLTLMKQSRARAILLAT